MKNSKQLKELELPGCVKVCYARAGGWQELPMLDGGRSGYEPPSGKSGLLVTWKKQYLFLHILIELIPFSINLF